MSTKDMKNILMKNTHPHLVCLTPQPNNKKDLLRLFALSGIDLQGSSFRLENGTKITIANIESEIPTDDFHLAYYNWLTKKGITQTQKSRAREWEKKASQIVNLFE